MVEVVVAVIYLRVLARTDFPMRESTQGYLHFLLTFSASLFISQGLLCIHLMELWSCVGSFLDAL